MNRFMPRLDILPEAQRRLWQELGQIPPVFTLYGEPAIALQLGHRYSVDFDFFGAQAIDPEKLQSAIPFAAESVVAHREKNTLTVIVERGEKVNVSFFGVPNLPRLAPPLISPDNGLKIASLLDLAGTKASVIQLRAESKDYLDLDALITTGKISLPGALAAAKALYGNAFNPQITLKALSYFADGHLRTLHADTKNRLAAAARVVDLDQLPTIASLVQGSSRDRGLGL